MHRTLSPSSFVLLSLLAVGCGSGSPDAPELVNAWGTVTLDDEPLADADLVFRPTGTTPGSGGTARTDAEGGFAAVYARGDEGLPAGRYRVTVSRRVMPDGSPVPADDATPPIESPARETLPPKYSDEGSTELTIEVKPNAPPLEIELGE